MLTKRRPHKGDPSIEWGFLIPVAQLPTGRISILATRDPHADGVPLCLKGSPEGKHRIPAGPRELCIINGIPGYEVDVRPSQPELPQPISKLLGLHCQACSGRHYPPPCCIWDAR